MLGFAAPERYDEIDAHVCGHNFVRYIDIADGVHLLEQCSQSVPSLLFVHCFACIHRTVNTTILVNFKGSL